MTTEIIKDLIHKSEENTSLNMFEDIDKQMNKMFMKKEQKQAKKE